MSGLNVRMAGQTINDRLLAARHSIAGQGLAKSVCKATTEEMIAPKKKHLDCKYCFGKTYPLERHSQCTHLFFRSIIMTTSPQRLGQWSITFL